MRVPDKAVRRAVAYGSLNGVRQELALEHEHDAVVINGLLVRDWPVFIELKK